MTAARVAYFSMEIAVDDSIPTYSGGLGVLAGDHLRACADMGIPVVGVTLLYNLGFFRQRIDATGRQVEEPVRWDPASRLELLPVTVTVDVAGRPVTVQAWRRDITGVGGHVVPVVFLDTRVPGNRSWDAAITDQLYTAEPRCRLAQEVVLGFGGPAVLTELGFPDFDHYHLNEGHASLVPVALALGRTGGGLRQVSADVVADVRRRSVFTTHTPVAAGHDRFDPEVTSDILGSELAGGLAALGCLEGDGACNMTVLGMYWSGHVNAVSRRHGEVTRAMFPKVPLATVTNGAHAGTWVVPSTAEMLDEHIPLWRADNALLRYATGIPLASVRKAHAEAKAALLEEIERRTGTRLDPAACTLGFARRATPYKRNDLLVSDPDRLRSLAARVGPIQIVYSGKAHPRDTTGKELIARVVAASQVLGARIPVVYLEDYGMELARLLVAGVDLWCNTPTPPLEASGTSGMKAALNAVPSLSTLDGWWLEGHVEGVTGWSIGSDEGMVAERSDEEGRRRSDADREACYRTLQDVVLPLFYGDPDGWAAVGRGALAYNGSFFNSERMVGEYVAWAYGGERRVIGGVEPMVATLGDRGIRVGMAAGEPG